MVQPMRWCNGELVEELIDERARRGWCRAIAKLAA